MVPGWQVVLRYGYLTRSTELREVERQNMTGERKWDDVCTFFFILSFALCIKVCEYPVQPSVQLLFGGFSFAASVSLIFNIFPPFAQKNPTLDPFIFLFLQLLLGVWSQQLLMFWLNSFRWVHKSKMDVSAWLFLASTGCIFMCSVRGPAPPCPLSLKSLRGCPAFQFKLNHKE